MKRITLALLTVLLVVGAVLLPVFAANTGGVAASEAAGKIGDTVTVTVSVQDLPAVTGFAIYCEVPEGLSLVKEADQSKWLLPNLEIADVDFEKNAAVCALDEAIDCTLATEIFQFAFVIEEPEAGAALPEEFAVPIMVIASDASGNQTKYTCEAKITASIPADGIVLNKNTLMLDLSAKKEETLFVTLTPENTTDVVNWKSSDESVATVDENGKVTAVAQGTAKITATAGAVSADSEVVVYAGNGKLDVGTATLSLEGEVYIEYIPVLEGFEGIDLTNLGGLAIWTGGGKPASSSLIMPEAENCVTLKNMHWSEQFNAWIVTTTGINAKECGDVLYMRPFIELAEGEYINGSVVWYSPEMYCEDKLKNSNDVALKEVCASLLAYGAAAQEYFDYKTEDLMGTDLDLTQYNLEFTEDMLDSLKPAGPKTATLTGTKAKIGSAKASLTLEGAIVLEVVFPEVTAENILSAELLVWTEEDYNATENFAYAAGTYTFKVPLTKGKLGSDEGYVASLKDETTNTPGIAVKEIGNTVYFAAYVVTEEGVYRTGMNVYSPDTYIQQKLTSGDPELVEVCKALAVYGEKARACFGSGE